MRRTPPRSTLNLLGWTTTDRAPQADPCTVEATTFARHFARYQDAAVREKVIVITCHHRVVGGYLSADEFAHYQRLKARERKFYRTEDLPDDLIAAIEAAEYGVPTQ